MNPNSPIDLLDNCLMFNTQPSYCISRYLQSPEFQTYPFLLIHCLDKQKLSVNNPSTTTLLSHTFFVVDELSKRLEFVSSPRPLMWTALLHHLPLTSSSPDTTTPCSLQGFLSSIIDDQTLIESILHLSSNFNKTKSLFKGGHSFAPLALDNQGMLNDLVILNLCHELSLDLNNDLQSVALAKHILKKSGVPALPTQCFYPS